MRIGAQEVYQSRAREAYPLVVDEDDYTPLADEGDPFVADVHPGGLTQDIEGRAGGGSDLTRIEDHAVRLALHDGSLGGDLYCSEFLGLVLQ